MDSTRLAQIRKEFYFSVRSRVEAILGRESPQLQSYRQNYESELSRLNYSFVQKKHFLNRLKKARIVLVGDFHALKQSSRGLLRILRKMNHKIILCVECLSHEDQGIINQFILGSLSEKDFLSRVQWKKNWSFPWENYRPLFKWAQQNKVLVFGINTQSGQSSLKKRDEESAQVIKKISREHPGKQIFIQYGDLHLASAHLPRQIKKVMPKVDLCIVYQTPEILYFKIMNDQKESTTDVVKLTDTQWALNVLPPWVKWQDYLLYLESGYDKRIKRSEHDLTDSVAHSVLLLSQSLGFSVGTSSLSVYSSLDETFFEQLEKLSSPIKKRLLESMQEGLSFYIPELQIAYLARPSVNHVSKVAAQYLYFMKKGFLKTISDPRKDFLKLIWLEMVTYLCSKIANPKRKSDTLQDIRSALQKEHFDDRGKQALMLALNQKLSEMRFNSAEKSKNTQSINTKIYNQKSYVIAAQILGGIMGEKFYFALSKRHLKLPQDQRIIFKDLNAVHFKESYFEALELIESWPMPFKSKFDRL